VAPENASMNRPRDCFLSQVFFLGDSKNFLKKELEIYRRSFPVSVTGRQRAAKNKAFL
jgi:hypothetical protein